MSFKNIVIRKLHKREIMAQQQKQLSHFRVHTCVFLYATYDSILS